MDPDRRPSVAYHSPISPTDDFDLLPSKEFEPIAGLGQRQGPNARGRDTSGASACASISRTRSHNGYGCDENQADSEGQDVEGQTREKDPFDVWWQGGDSDPLNPRSLSLARKWSVVLIVSASSLCVTCTSSIYTSTYGQITKEFRVSRIVATIGLSLFIIGLGVGPMLLGPLSEFYGRRPIYLVSFSMFLIWLIPSAVAQNIQTMFVARFLDGLSGSAFLSVAGGTVGDLFNREQLQLPMLIYTASPFVGPSLGPLLGGFINQYTQWRWTFYVLLIWSGANLGMIMFFVPETYHPILLRNKARKLREETGDGRWMSTMDRNTKSIPRTIGLSLLRPFQLLFLEPMVLNLCLFSAILLGILYLFFGAFPLVFQGNHGFTLSETGLSFLGIFVGMVLGSATGPIWDWNYARLTRQREEHTGEVGGSEPEYRLPPSIMGAVLVPCGLFIFAWTTTVLVFSGIFTFLVDAYPLYAASSLAANSFARSSFAAAFPLFGVQMYHQLGDQWATSVLAFLTLAMAPFPYIFFVYGKRIRGTSRFAIA
ncbi:hypothetical protein B2J93_1930 [Marssonina coronariae]|uniref:Major facilitator superfamily (MFS) profile domain-containing protein n=1 Tax=Diplocarpon coronariae TaxID=2795749 RepID=A0A218YW90_9HELO|nr:hypothetical protein B2J93_1930 [Marssonina coronariae]